MMTGAMGLSAALKMVGEKIRTAETEHDLYEMSKNFIARIGNADAEIDKDTKNTYLRGWRQGLSLGYEAVHYLIEENSKVYKDGKPGDKSKILET